MINVESLIQLKAFARQDGAMLSLLWIASFAAMVLAPQSFMGNLLAIATPFFTIWRLGKFRDYALDGAVSFRRGYVYSVYTFFYAAIIFAITQYVYFKFLDSGHFTGILSQTMTALEPAYEQSGVSKEEITNTIKIMKEMTPIQWAFIFMIQNLFIGFIASVPIAAVCMRNAKKNK